MSKSKSVLQQSFYVRGEEPGDETAIDALVREVFGPGMTARAAYALREGVRHELVLSHVAFKDDGLAGSVRLTRVLWGEQIALMLGPLGVLSRYKSQGIGSALMKAAVESARRAASAGGPPVIFLVGDLPYYRPFGFNPVPRGRIVLPRPADPNRILVCELIKGAADGYSGQALRLASFTGPGAGKNQK